VSKHSACMKHRMNRTKMENGKSSNSNNKSENQTKKALNSSDEKRVPKIIEIKYQ
jgi:hypothetical protein